MNMTFLTENISRIFDLYSKLQDDLAKVVKEHAELTEQFKVLQQMYQDCEQCETELEEKLEKYENLQDDKTA
jgi:DNA anti-recombination protein RmuC